MQIGGVVVGAPGLGVGVRRRQTRRPTYCRICVSGVGFRDFTIAEDAQGTPSQSHISPSILEYAKMKRQCTKLGF